MDVKKTLTECRESALNKFAHMKHEEMLVRIKSRRKEIGLDVSKISNDIEIEEKIISSSDKIIDVAMDILSNLSGLEYDVLFYYYIVGYNWDKVADFLHWSIRTVHNARKSAFNKLNAIYEEEYK